ncbi:DHH family phosphoesterase [Streptococcus constellatus subsp. pharyngis]|uniref:DHHA1 domain protein n=1 Tax=Streptococcus constellatus subsp. pharyngis SK1060 = CCUG 46377 TaxID=1035184 RepID=F9P8J4_STRCV|nr:bifunctional oligoribonuclease/PAP phosphatase NrnA [Streptococcus constellatus]AGU73156.1 DHH subfamily 1 protein [Streptococcus constellatus subsp. pharyngis C232]AGU74910.1 DHH subfamily 1 protein [Streptococcus constellatus subsp. pharyngis C818]AGU80301.1 DHH subfamily 1 protein [Streptococcus constellatus subsp. pharyngis C1050]EGV08460.1 DHHA1 domain protein [Streptococcus constellatus subsp. pharyngis SK1060 = CCUG 46377]QQC22958.1 bifunctional oligoribonuclease/PAP phosphatase NrnA
MEIFKQILHKIKEYDTIIIHRHMRPDPDALGSQVGLKKLLQVNFPEKKIKAAGKTEPTLAWLAKMDDVSDDDYKHALVIVCDTANTARIDDERYNKGDFLIKIDHHPNDDIYGDIAWVDTSSSSASELIALFALENKLKLDDYSAKLLYAGIVGDTGRFLYPATTARTMAVASKLRKYPFDFAALARKMDSFSYQIAKLQGYVYNHLEVDENGAARVILTQELLKANHLTDADTSAIVSAPGRIDSVELWGIFVEQENGNYRVRLRSKFIPINEVAKKHDGGGHPLASGANAYSKEEIEEVYQELKELAKRK